MGIKGLSIFCDESHPIKNDGCDFYVLGCCYTATEHLSDVIDNINKIKRSHGYDDTYEVKWSRINGKNLSLAYDLIKYIKEDNLIFNRVWIVPNKTGSIYSLILNHETLYNRMYRQLLKYIFENKYFCDVTEATISFDVRNSKSDSNAKLIEKFLELNFPVNVKTEILDSLNAPLIQIIDLLIGATSYERIMQYKSDCKVSLIQKIKKEFNRPQLNMRTSKDNLKYNSFIWDGRYGRI